MNNKIDDATKDRILDDLLAKHAELDDVCREIFLTLWAYEKLRFNQLLRTLKKLEIKITQPTLTAHLSHLIKKGIVEKEESFQETSYSLRSDIHSVLYTSPEDLKEWLEALHRNDEKLPKRLQPLKMTQEEFFNKLPEEHIDKMAVNDISDVLSLSLFELRNYINYDLQIGKFESDAAFWKFVGNPIYRMREKSIANRCRASEEYKRRLFEKIDLLMNELRSDKELLREREEEERAL